MGCAMDPNFYAGRPYIYVGYTADPLHNTGMNYNMVSGTPQFAPCEGDAL